MTRHLSLLIVGALALGLAGCDAGDPGASAPEAASPATTAAAQGMWADSELHSPSGTQSVVYTGTELGSKTFTIYAEYFASKDPDWTLKGRLNYAYLGYNAPCEEADNMTTLTLNSWTSDPVTGSTQHIAVDDFYYFKPDRYGMYRIEARAWINSGWGILMSQETQVGCLHVKRPPGTPTPRATISGPGEVQQNSFYDLQVSVSGLPGGVSVSSYYWEKDGVDLNENQSSIFQTAGNSPSDHQFLAVVTLSDGSQLSDFHDVSVGGPGGGGW